MALVIQAQRIYHKPQGDFYYHRWGFHHISLFSLQGITHTFVSLLYLCKQNYTLVIYNVTSMATKDIWFILRSAFIAGLCIGIAGFGYLAEKNIIGAVLFSFGLLAVVGYSLKLYTGTAGFFKKGEFSQVLLILFGNILGCGAMSLILRCSPLPLQETAQGIMEARLALGPVKGGILAIGCGFIMTTIVTFAREGKNLPMLFGIPVFINCGFPHCVADSFFYLCVPTDFTLAHLPQVLTFWLAIASGNFLGCNLYRIIMRKTK